ncbi:MAG: hypothetical protein E7004_03985 [Alphaproteobacteria bacterium]|nr:hypothetical protein [Alphaproteobacteria bacterium]
MFVAKYVNGKWNLFAGIIMLLLGLMVWFNPFDTLLALAFYIGVGFIVTGFLYLMSAYEQRMGWYLLVGSFDVLVGVVLISNLGITAVSLPIILALWSLTIGIIQIISSLELKSIDLPWKSTAVMGYVGLFFGLAILIFPTIGAVAISTAIGFYAIMFGIIQILEYRWSKRNPICCRKLV